MRSTGQILLLLIALALTAVPLPSQNVNPMHPEEIHAQKPTSPDDMRARAANLQLQKDAKDLSDLCASVAHDMDGVKQGLMAQDLVEKLKRLEKLSKRVSEQLARSTLTP
jgi:hypothetical protein